MLSFELSVIDIILAIAIIVILLLQVKKTPTESTTEPKLSREKKKPFEGSKKSFVKRKTLGKKKFLAHTPEGSIDCPHHFGYLKKLSLGSSVPEECYNCSQMMQCLFSDEQNSGELRKIA